MGDVDESSKIVLSFPSGTEAAEPLINYSQNHSVFAINIPTNIFSPSFNRLSDGNGTMRYEHHMRILTMLFHLFDMNKNVNLNRATVNDTFPRLVVYVEYLVDKNVNIQNPETFSCPLFSCRYIRFYFVLNDHLFDIQSELLSILNGEVKKTKKKGAATIVKRTAGGVPVLIEKLYAYHTAIQSERDWIDCCETYLGKTKDVINSYHMYVDNEGEIRPDSEVYLQNLLSFSSENQEMFHILQQNQDSRNICFGLPKMTFRIPDYMWSPIAIMAVTLPGTVKWTRASHEQQQEIARILLSNERLYSHYESMYTKRNDLADLKELYTARSMMSNARKDNSLVMETVDALQNLWCAGVGISNPIRLMNKWSSEFKTWSITPEPTCFDNQMTYFGNMMVEDMLSLEQDFFLHTSHTIFMRLAIASLNAYWYSLSLHVNISMLGGGASGKSHLLDLIREIFIPFTVTKTTHATDKSATIDGDMNDHISIFHEAPPQMLGQNAKGSEQQTGSHIIKEMLTSCEVVTQSMKVDEFGRRKPIRSISECSGVILLATNECAATVPEALNTRTMKVDVNQTKRKLFDIQTMNDMYSRAKSNPERVTSKNVAVNKWRVRQVMVNMVEKMIYTGILMDVDTRPGYIVLDFVLEKLKKDGILMSSEDSVRGIGFIKLFARTLTIIHAVDKYARDPSSPGYNKAFEFRNLTGISPYLVCTEELMMFTLTNLSDQLINTNMLNLINLILSHCQRDNATKDVGLSIADKEFECRSSDYRDRRSLYLSLITTQKNNSFRTKMSLENMKVAMAKVTKESYKDQVVLIHDESASVVRLNRRFVDLYFNRHPETGVYESKITPTNMIVQAYIDAYTHKCSTGGKKFILGSIPNYDYPFILDSFTTSTNPGKTITIHDKDVRINYCDHQQSTTNSIHKAYKMIDFSFEKDVSMQRGAKPDNVDVILYGDYHDQPHRLYPDNIIKKFNTVYGLEEEDGGERKRPRISNISDE